MFNLRKLQGCLENNVCDFVSLQKMFSPFFSVFFFQWGCAKHRSQDDSSVFYRRGCGSRLNLTCVDTQFHCTHAPCLTKLLSCICSFWTKTFEVHQEKHQSQYSYASFFVVAWCYLGHLRMAVWREACLQALSETPQLSHLPHRQYRSVAALS